MDDGLMGKHRDLFY